ncbi:MAG: radical SAM protein [Desulfobacteraceae bacterium]|nr:radical SAM protein [Desulfobacteraceae bacterium]
MRTEAIHKYNFETGVYRPPSEGGSYSLLVRFTRNCPWNRCTFCGMYKTEKFEVRSPDEIRRDIDAIAAIRNDLRDISRELGYGGELVRAAVIELFNRVPELNYHQGFVMVYDWLHAGGKTAFLQDANSPIMKTDKLVDALRYLRKTFPSIIRVTSYARSKTLAQKKPGELEAIRKAGLDRLHVGLESGDDDLLQTVRKGVNGESHIKGGQKAMQAGFELSEYWMPGLGGKGMWRSHARNTARVLSAINPDYIRSRPFFPAPGTPLGEDHEKGQFTMLSADEQLLELKLMMEELNVTSKVCFDHAGNYWRNRNGGLLFSQSYEGYKFPEEKPKVLRLIEEGLTAQSKAPAFLRL